MMPAIMSIYKQALRRFRRISNKVHRAGLTEPTAMSLATSTPRGRPSVRVVLLKGMDSDGFVFYTNKTSQKGRELKNNPYAALCFFWDPLDEQVRIEGSVEIVTADEADVYWKTRPRESQLGAWASFQSQPLQRRADFISRLKETKRRFTGKEIPRPPHWSGYRLRPQRIEFWKRRPFRLHDRIVYENKNGRWRTYLLYP
jgi:pyridoxamine 5'-phosphate oxidase